MTGLAFIAAVVLAASAGFCAGIQLGRYDTANHWQRARRNHPTSRRPR